MGINVSVYRQDEKGRVIEHPDWDWGRMDGDRLLPMLMPVEVEIGPEEYWSRPADPTEMRKTMTELYPENSARWEQLEAILLDPRWWVYFSY